MPNIHQAILIASPAESIYQAITQTEGLSAWWTPGSSAKAEANSIARFPFGDGYYKEMKIVQLVPGLFVKWICSKGDNEWIDTTVSFSLEQGDEQTLLGAHPEIKGQMDQQQNVEPNTLLIFRHDDWKDYTLMFAECSYTWAQFLRSLKLFCETGQGKPWPGQHRESI